MIKTIIAALAIAVLTTAAITITSDEKSDAQTSVGYTALPIVQHKMGDWRVGYWASSSDSGYDRAIILPMFNVYMDLKKGYWPRWTESREKCWMLDGML